MRTKDKTPRASLKPASVRPSSGPAGLKFPIVGVGASAGGLEAFTQLLKRLPLDTGFGFVLVQHLDPQHESALAQLLTRATAMPVCEVTNNLRVEANHVYIIPPNTGLTIVRGVLKLQARAQAGGPHRSIDFFFESLARDRRECAIGVILSGSATDGTLGLEAIKAEGGITFAQDDSARYDSMPRSAVSAGCVDFVLSPEAIAKELSRLASHPYVAGSGANRAAASSGKNGLSGPTGRKAQSSGARASVRTPSRSADSSVEAASFERTGSDEPGYKEILLFLRNHCGVDFSLYKATTIHRRIMRRAVLNRQETMENYAHFLRGNSKELDALYSDALISVTSFFRNEEAFDVLQRKVFAKLLQQRGGDPLRVWVLGCSTGQEAYSLAMAYAELAEKATRPRKLQVFATDLNDANLDKARHGFYPKSIVQDVSPERLRRFFVEGEGGYRVIKSLREAVVFARQNLISDPPFSRIDLISCRNLMIYLESSLQKKALPTFHYALKPEGYLFLGASESVGSFTDLFEPVDKKQKIFSKKAAPTLTFQLPVQNRSGSRVLPAPAAVRTAEAKKHSPVPDGFRGELNPQREADRVTVNQFAPPAVLINDALQILQFRGPTSAYLEPPTGKASFDLLKMAREGLMLPLRAAIAKARKDNKTARKDGVTIEENGATRRVNLEVVPLKNLKERCYLVLFEDANKAARGATNTASPKVAQGSKESSRPLSKKQEASRILDLERDLAETRDYLQSVEEHQEAANEELQASNEEGQSANEELQSLNEELETSKEELESTNEELTTVNEEMATRNVELNRANADLTNLQTSTKLVIVLLGRDLTISRFSAQAERQFGLLANDVGRRIGAIRHNLQIPDLDAMISAVIDSMRECEREVRDIEGRWFSLRVRPYVTLDNKVDGAVLVLMDIDALKKTEQLIADEHEHAEAVVRTVPSPLIILNSDLRLKSANDAFYRLFKISPIEAKGRSIFEISGGSWDIPRLRELLGEIIPRNSFFNDYEVTYKGDKSGRRSLLLNARMLNEPGSRQKEILLGIQDVTEVLTFQTDLRRSEVRYRRLFEAAQDGILILDPVTRKITEANPFIVRLLGYSREQLVGKELWQIGLLKDEAASQEAFGELKEKGFIRYEDLPLKAKGGQRREVEFVSNRYLEDGEEFIQCNIRDITERKLAEEALRASEGRFRALFELGPIGVYSCDALGRLQEFNRCAVELWGRKPRLGDPGEQFCGSHKMYLPGGKRLPHAQCPMADVLTGKVASVRDTEVVIERPDGTRITANANIVPLINDDGEIVGAINCFYDISERKRGEEALIEARANLAAHAGKLEKEVAERTVELTATNKRLKGFVESIGKSKEEYRELFLQSQTMQKKLRQLTRQIITAQEEERKEISRELHDEVVQTLVGINVELSALSRGSSVGVHALKAKIAHTQRLVENSVNEVHRFARELRPAVLDDLGLIPALHAYSKSLAARKKIKVQMTAFGGVEALDGAGRTVLFRVAQEAMNNVVRHAHASQIKLTISEVSGAIRMEIGDNGKSFHVDKVFLAKNPKRLGLIGMKERMEMVGGTLSIESAPGKGTTVRAEIPFKQEKIE